MTTKERQFAYLQAMGVQAWEPRVARVADVQVSEAQTQSVSASSAAANEVSNDAVEPTTKPVAASAVSSVDTLLVETAASPIAEARVSPLSGPVSEPAFIGGDEPPPPTDDYMPSLEMSEADLDTAPVATPAINVATLDWPELQTTVSACTACELHQSRTQTVFGTGSHTAEWMIIGEAPGADEDKQGEPFVGPSGQLLNNMLRALGLKREQVYIANILKCRPAGDRDPHAEEVAQCEAYLQRQIALVAPKVILAMGGVAAHNLLKLKTPITKLRGELYQYGETPLVATYHPAYLLRKPSEKAKSWADLKFAASVARGEKDGGP